MTSIDIRIVHLSDLHIARKRHIARADKTARKAILETLAIALLKPSLEFDTVLITGDIADSGEIDNLTHASEFLYAPPNKSMIIPCSHSAVWGTFPTIKALTQPIYIIPGNHDRYNNFITSTTGNEQFDEIFRPHWEKGFGGVDVFYYPNESEPLLAIIGADFCLKKATDTTGSYLSSVTKRYGQGKVYTERLDSLREETKKAKKNALLSGQHILRPNSIMFYF